MRTEKQIQSSTSSVKRTPLTRSKSLQRFLKYDEELHKVFGDQGDYESVTYVCDCSKPKKCSNVHYHQLSRYDQILGNYEFADPKHYKKFSNVFFEKKRYYKISYLQYKD